jgi:hypothetical protein
VTLGTAAYYCVNLTSEGYDDWFLPSKDELKLMLSKNLRDVLNMDTYNHWSSTEINATKAWVINYFGWLHDDWPKVDGSNAIARPIRAF